MSFRKKNREAEGEDVKVSREKEQSSKQQPSQAEQQPEPEQQPESTPQQSNEQSDESSGEQPTSDDEEDDAEPVPDGTTAEILRWVDGDKDKARRALAQEEADESPRKGLTSELHRVLDSE